MVGILAKSKEYSNAICIFNNLRGGVVVAGSCYTHRQDGAWVAPHRKLFWFSTFSWFFINTSTDNACPSRGPHWPGPDNVYLQNALSR